MVYPTTPGNVIIYPGDLVTSNFESDFILTYFRPPDVNDIFTQDVRFYRDEMGLVLETITTPDSFYSLGVARVMLPSGFGWVPFKWMRIVSEIPF